MLGDRDMEEWLEEPSLVTIGGHDILYGVLALNLFRIGYDFEFCIG